MSRYGRVRVLITVPWGERLGGAESFLWTFLSHFDPNRLEPVVVFFAGGAFERDVASLGLRTFVIDAGRLREAPSRRAHRAPPTPDPAT